MVIINNQFLFQNCAPLWKILGALQLLQTKESLQLQRDNHVHHARGIQLLR